MKQITRCTFSQVYLFEHLLGQPFQMLERWDTYEVFP